MYNTVKEFDRLGEANHKHGFKLNVQVKHLDNGNNSELVRTPQKYWMESPPVH